VKPAGARRAARPLGILVLVILCGGAITYSVRSVRYRVDEAPVSEFVVTKLSLTHSVERDSSGALTNPYVQKASVRASSKRAPTAPKASARKTGRPAPPKMLNKQAKPGSALKKPAAKKPPPKAVVPKKPAPKKSPAKKPTAKKPSPKKPAKRPSQPAACPT